MKVEGSIAQIRYKNEDNQYTVALMETEDGDITIVGILPALREGDYVQVEGEFVFHPTFGEQIDVKNISYLPPNTPEAIEVYLSSGAFTGIGPVTAKRIVAAFGKKTLKIMEENPRRLLEVPGIGEKTLEKILEGIEAQRDIRDILIYLQNMGISLNQSYRIIKEYGEQTPWILSNNPYKMIEDIRGIGFRTADAIALKNDIAQDSIFRIEAGLRYVLQEASETDGHCFLPKEILARKTAELLHIHPNQATDVIFQMVIQKDLLVKEYGNVNGVYFMPLYRAENNVAGRLAKKIILAKEKAEEETDSQILEYEHREGISLGEEQKEAVHLAMSCPVLVITGGPGTGKTTILKCILNLLEQKGERAVLCAPTGRAAKRMEESTGHEAKTIHRLLGYRPGEKFSFEYDEDNPLFTDVLIVDEASMMDIYLMNNLTAAMDESTRMIFVGDMDQLPSVGPGNVLGDLIASRLFSTVYLHKIYRQQEESNIVINAHRINRGLKPYLNQEGKDFFLIRSKSAEDSLQTIVDLVSRRLPKSYAIDPIGDIQILSPVKKGETGVKHMNEALQESLNPPEKDKKEIRHYGILYREGDKVMQMKNDYQMEWEAYGQKGSGIYNGELGRISAIDTETERVYIEFDEGRVVVMEKKDLDGVSLAYAGTIHKSQGSEYPVVVIPLHGWNPFLYTRNLIYTAITRAQKLVVLVGEEKVLSLMVENNRIAMRYSGLANQIFQMTKNLRGK